MLFRSIALDRRRQGKKGSNNDWQPTTDEAARRAKLNEGRTHMAYKPVHVVDLESGAIVSAVIHPAEQGDTQHWPPRLTMRRPNCARSGAGKEPSGIDDSFDQVVDKGFHSRSVLQALPGSCRGRINEAAYGNRGRLKFCKARP